MLPVVVSSSEPMVGVRVVVVKDSLEQTLRTLQKVGVLHVEEAKELDPVDKAAIESERNRVRESLSSINDVLSYVTEREEVLLSQGVSLKSPDDIMAEVSILHDRFTNLYQKTISLQEEIRSLEELGRYLRFLVQQADLRLRDLNYYGDYLFTRVLVLSGEAYQLFREKAGEYLLQDTAVAAEDEVIDYVIARVKDQRAVEGLVEDLGAITLKIPDEDLTLRSFLEEIADSIGSRKDQLAELQEEIQRRLKDNLEQIVFLREVLAAENDRMSVLEQACEAKYVTLIEGWVPESDVEMVTSEVRETVGYVFIDARKPEPLEEPPTKMRNPSGVRPFEVIVNLFSRPKYGQWDPTPIVAYSFAFFFGLMLNDVVYAVGLILAARFLLNKLVDDPDSEGVRLFKRVLYTSGGVALVFGLLSGTYLGDFLYKFFGIQLETIALVGQVQQQLVNPISFIVLSLLIGLVHVNIAHVLALIRGVKEGDKGMVVGKIGLFMLQIFGIPYIFRALLHIDLLPLSPQTYSMFAYPLIGGLVLLILAGFMMRGGLGGIFWIFDLTGLLGDVMSYSRLAGVGLATFYLASSFNLLADWLSSSLANVIPGIVGVILASIVVIVMLLVTHLFNMALSSLAAFIHSLRLCFVEFLLKFYEGGGREYAPFRPKFRRRVVVGAKS